MNEQLIKFFNQHFNVYLSAFRPGYGTQSTLLKTIEDWKKALDENKYVAAILMDLSKAFDCLLHDLLLLKIKFYGVSNSALDLIQSYLLVSNRKQCVKIGNFMRDFKTVYKGVPQGSILGPVLFNIFINDIFHFITDSSLYNNADENTESYVHTDPLVCKNVFTNDSLTLVKWFSDNQMQANPDKFQGIAIGQKSKKENLTFNLGGDCIINCDEEVKLLGETIDFKLKFDIHKASKQSGVLKRIGKNLCELGKLNIYHSFILLDFSYCPLTWYFCGEANTKKLEKIQERALRFIYNDYVSNYDTLLALSKMPTLKLRRLRTMASEVFKILHKEFPVYLHDLICFKNNHYSFRYTRMAEIPQVRTTRFGSSSFCSSAAKLWNSLPQHFREVLNFNHFKSLINAWNGGDCVCSFSSAS